MDENAPTVSWLNRLVRNFRLAWGVSAFLAVLVIISWTLVAWMWSRALQSNAAMVQNILPHHTPAQAVACAPVKITPQAPALPAGNSTALASSTAEPLATAVIVAGVQPSLSADLATHLNQLAASGSPFEMDLFVMSKCPYGNIAEAVILPWLQAHPGTADFHLWFIASGDASGGFQSLHGPGEVSEDLRQEVILNEYPDKLFGYLACRNGNYSDDNGWIVCANQSGLDSKQIASLAQTSAAANALAQSAQNVQKLGVHVSPTIYLNGQPYSGSPFTLPQQAAQANTSCNPSASQPVKVNAVLDPGLQARLDQLASGNQKLHLELFVMSLCPYGNLAETVLLPWLKAHPGNVSLSLQYIAENDGSGFQSLHGPNEVSEDMRQLAILNLYPARLNDYLACRSANYTDPNGWSSCFTNLSLDPDEISQLAQSSQIADSLRTSLTRANNLGVQASPTLYLNGNVYNGAIFDIQQ